MIIPGSWACTWVRITCIERWVFVLVCKMVSCHFEWHQYKDVIIADTLYVLVWFNIQQKFSKIRICLRIFLGRTRAVEKHRPAPAQPQGSRLTEDCLLHFTFLYKKYPLIPPSMWYNELVKCYPSKSAVDDGLPRSYFRAGTQFAQKRTKAIMTSFTMQHRHQK